MEFHQWVRSISFTVYLTYPNPKNHQVRRRGTVVGMAGGGRTRESGDQITDKLRVSEEKGRNRGRKYFEDGEYDSKSSHPNPTPSNPQHNPERPTRPKGTRPPPQRTREVQRGCDWGGWEMRFDLELLGGKLKWSHNETSNSLTFWSEGSEQG